MENTRKNLKKIFETPSYWVEAVNGELYSSIVRFMEENNMNQTQLAEYFKISKGRVSQILNDGEINFKIEKVIEIALKINKYPLLKFKDKEEYLNEKSQANNIRFLNCAFDYNKYFPTNSPDNEIDVDENNNGYVAIKKNNEDVFKLQLA